MKVLKLLLFYASELLFFVIESLAWVLGFLYTEVCILWDWVASW